MEVDERMAEPRKSDRDMMRELAVTIRNATRPKEGESERALESCWDGLFELLEIKVEAEE